MGKKIVFLDRDGVINKLVEREGLLVSPRTFNDFEILPGVPDAIRILRDAVYEVVVVTNQPDISRGLMRIEELELMHKLVYELGVSEIKVCPHSDVDNCMCRKPKPGMITSYLSSLENSDYQAWMVGDEDRDMEASRNAGIPAIRLTRDRSTNIERSHGQVQNLYEAVNMIIESQVINCESDQN